MATQTMRAVEERADNSDLAALVRTIPDFPKPGIMFRDVTRLFLDAHGLRSAVERLAAPFAGRVDMVAGIDARGFILGGALAVRLGTGFAAIRKKGKLPPVVFSERYALEYGEDELEVHIDAIPPGSRVLLVDDLIATGGTARAATVLLGRAGATVAGAGFVIDLPDLGGTAQLRALGVEVHALLEFAGH